MSQDFQLNYKVSIEQLSQKLVAITVRYMSLDDAKILVDYIVKAELMGVSTHGLHYFVHTIHPLLQKRNYRFINRSDGNMIVSEGEGGDIGILNLHSCLEEASKLSEEFGICLISIKNPGKVGALRIYAESLIEKNKLIILLKNTASTQGTVFSQGPLIGTNPICFGFPGSSFIFDTSTSSVATNSIRLRKKQNQEFSQLVGYDDSGQRTKDPKKLLQDNAYLSTFADGPFWYKSFFLGLAIECFAALAGGKTGKRVGKMKGSRLYSKEGMIGIVIDKSVFPFYESYKNEIKLLFSDLESAGIYIPGSYDKSNKEVFVSKTDWAFICNL
jgi:ureidoglycolate dehydrogenase (NAD+)